MEKRSGECAEYVVDLTAGERLGVRSLLIVDEGTRKPVTMDWLREAEERSPRTGLRLIGRIGSC